ncbi:MAG: hypothetical protein DKM50_11345 [Candidatus Margulisiibacteriota bacterium]|nr:MAG: hypothetical protein A2X43_12165 [Candidatus Margulisbacteria bacterium GWD2_39_127]OGI03211.1 MAG: hypothetical protein A2X42_11405 [Candidatus Margulisbacteria bacterium GWF2_38_17]OGI11235.1 MAG: hypothetical protein A2X41_03830 [Candidatus Margulisbacteria bacterium GWE2_39_32]PZM78550.1 MAG: hypothetical protein DKM50_11345 [Candidatus Margulisiibacteriota bacterium]HAR63883.1 hypothetical protein [Candidatus Margulisiibacteriota bacterium]
MLKRKISPGILVYCFVISLFLGFATILCASTLNPMIHTGLNLEFVQQAGSHAKNAKSNNESTKNLTTSTGKTTVDVARHGNTQGKKVSLTFDDGPDPVTTPLILDILKKHNIKATFFMIGEKVKRYPEIAAMVVREGHGVGNHTYHHINLNKASEDKIINEIEWTQKSIKNATGVTPTLFRPPFGYYDDNALRALNKEKMKIILWSIDPLDYIQKRNTKIISEVTDKLKKGSIILFHDTSKNTAKYLDLIINDISNHNYQFDNLNEAHYSPIIVAQKDFTAKPAIIITPLLSDKKIKRSPLIQANKISPAAKTWKPKVNSPNQTKENADMNKLGIKEVKPEKHYLIELPQGKDLISTLVLIAKTKNIHYGKFEIVGTVKNATIGYYTQEKNEYIQKTVNQPTEIISCDGSIQEHNGNHIIRASISVSDSNNTIHRGRLFSGTIIINGEAYIQSFRSTSQGNQ